MVSNGRKKLHIVWGVGGRNKLSVGYTSSRYLIGLCSIFDCSSFQFWATTSASWHEGVLDDGLCHFGAVGAHRLGSDFAAGLIYVLFFSWITLSLAAWAAQKGEKSRHLIHFTFGAEIPKLCETHASFFSMQRCRNVAPLLLVEKKKK